MILKKMTVNGQEIHVRITEDEAKRYPDKENLLFTEDNEKQAFFDSLNQEEPPKFRSKRHRLIQMLPFMDEETIHELVLKIIDEGEFEGLDIAAIMPFVEEEDAGLLFKKALSGEYPNLNPMKIAPFVDEADLSFVVDAYIDGKLSEKMLDGLYPFLEDDDLKRLFKHILNQK